MVHFRKMHGLGNDFVIIDRRGERQLPDRSLIMQACDRGNEITRGCDQFIVIEPSALADGFMRIYNPDASQAESCGNATRCVADIIMNETGRDSCKIETRGGLLICRRAENAMIEVDMGVTFEMALDAHEKWGDLPEPVAINVGNPHCVFFVDDVNDIDIEKIGPVIEHHRAFPERTNVEFAQILSPDKIRLRVWERGAGVTQACGSGACGTLAAAYSRGLTGRKAEIIMDGGSLFLERREKDNHILMTGPVAYEFEGKLAT
ncbi:MAG: diaminopimelate epimerase [Alphaproteobacteria bacterium]